MSLELITQGFEILESMGITPPMIWNKKGELIRDCKSRYLITYGGRDAAKSHSIAQKFIKKMEQKDYYFRGIMARKFFNSIKDSQFETMKQIIYDTGRKNDYQIRNNIYEFENKSTGLKVLPKGLDRPDKLKSIRDPSMIWWEEPNVDGITWEDFITSDTSLRGPRIEYLQNIFSFNSDDGEAWIKERFFPQGFAWEKRLPENHIVPSVMDNTTIIHFTYHDNVFVRPENKERLERLKDEDPEYYKVFALGLWGGKPVGQIVTNYEVIPDKEFNKIWHKASFYGIDWGFVDPMTLIEMKKHEGAVYVKERFCQSEKLVKDLIKSMKVENVRSHDPIYPDPSRPDSCKEIQVAGFNIHSADNSILDGLNAVKSWPLYITESSVNLLRELRFYKWAVDKEGKPIDKPIDMFNHCIDAMRYGIFNHYETNATAIGTARAMSKASQDMNRGSS